MDHNSSFGVSLSSFLTQSVWIALSIHLARTVLEEGPLMDHMIQGDNASMVSSREGHMTQLSQLESALGFFKLYLNEWYDNRHSLAAGHDSVFQKTEFREDRRTVRFRDTLVHLIRSATFFLAACLCSVLSIF